MAFKRRTRTRFRRRSKGPETYTLFQCRDFINIYSEMTCTNPLNAALTVWIPTPPVGASDPTTAGAVIGTKGHSLQGIKFQAEHILDPTLVQEAPECDPAPSQLNFMLTIWEALVVLPLAAGSKTLPAYLPTLPASQSSQDVADRVLWKRLTHMPFWGLGVTFPFPEMWSTQAQGQSGAGPQTVKSKVYLDDKHGLYYVRSFVHDVFGLSDNVECVIPLTLDFWAKIWYRTRTA
jgi:hypothetical protein